MNSYHVVSDTHVYVGYVVIDTHNKFSNIYIVLSLTHTIFYNTYHVVIDTHNKVK